MEEALNLSLDRLLDDDDDDDDDDDRIITVSVPTALSLDTVLL